MDKRQRGCARNTGLHLELITTVNKFGTERSI